MVGGNLALIRRHPGRLRLVSVVGVDLLRGAKPRQGVEGADGTPRAKGTRKSEQASRRIRESPIKRQKWNGKMPGKIPVARIVDRQSGLEGDFEYI